MIDKWKKLIENNRLDDLFSELKTSLRDGKLSGEILLIESIYNRIKEKSRKGLLKNDDREVKLNEVNEKILDFFSCHREDILNLTKATNEEESILTILESIWNEYAKLRSSSNPIKDVLIEFAEMFYKMGVVAKEIGFSKLDNEAEKDFSALIDKSIRRLIKGRASVKSFYEKYEIFYENYILQIDRLMSLLDIPKTYSEEEISKLKQLKKVLYKTTNALDSVVQNSEMKLKKSKETTINNIKGLQQLLSIYEVEKMSKKLNEMEKEAEVFFTDLVMYNTVKVYCKEDLEKAYHELKISLIEIEVKNHTPKAT